MPRRLTEEQRRKIYAADDAYYKAKGKRPDPTGITRWINVDGRQGAITGSGPTRAKGTKPKYESHNSPKWSPMRVPKRGRTDLA